MSNTNAERILFAAAASCCPSEALALARQWVARTRRTEVFVQSPERPLRGKPYYDHLKALLGVVGPSLADDARRLYERNGGLTPVDIGMFALEYGLNFKACCEWLEESHVLCIGTYDLIKDSSLKIGDILTEAHNRLATRPTYNND